MTNEMPPVDPATAQIVEQWSQRPKPQPPAKRPIPNRSPVTAPQNEAHRAAALQRFLADQTMLEEVKTRRRMLKYKGRRDVRWIFLWAGRLIKAYDMITAFVAAHLGGPVSRVCRDRRAAYCEQCTFRRRRESRNLPNLPVEGPLDRKDRCRGYDASGRPCDCWDDPLWRPGGQDYKVWLRFLACPLGHWDWGSYVPPLPEG